MTQLGVTRSRRGSARHDGVEMDGRECNKWHSWGLPEVGEAVPDRMAWRRMVGSAINDTVGLPEVGEAVPDRMAWRRMVGSAINDTVGGYQK